MKMKKAEVKFVVFASGDVITTSSDIGIVDTTVKTIYLRSSGIDTFNTIAAARGGMLLYPTTSAYGSYSGYLINLSLFGGGWRFNIVDNALNSLTHEQEQALVEVRNEDEYALVLDWLVTHGDKGGYTGPF